MSTIDTSAANIVSGYETAATGENEALRGYWNVGVEYRFVVDNGQSVDSLIAAIVKRDSKGYAARRGGTSKANLSKAGKLAKTFDSYAAMIASLDAKNLAHSFEVAYLHAVEVAGSGRGSNGAKDEVAVEVKRIAKLTAAKRRKLIAALREQFPQDFA